jgi:hypothetical protein|tara:strand:- start:499 stop:1773 length:1275 start_codon:yes stop_codon:yes gene_type:complete
MPLPSPNNGEKYSKFMDRCMMELSKKDEFKDNKQRAAVCYSQFNKERSNASLIVGEGSSEALFFSQSANENKPLNKPFRTPKGPKKFSVYVKNEKGNVVKVNFGDPNMEIKRDDPARRKSFRARHNCDNPGPKWKARYWSCKQWRAGKKVEGSVENDYEWDGETLFDHDELLAMNPELANAPEAEVSEAAKRSGRKSGAQTPAEPSERKKGSKKNPKGSAGEKGGKITFSEKTTNALKEKVKEHNSKHSKKVTLSQLKKVYRRGSGAFSTSHRPNMSRHGWAMARVNMFLKMRRGGKVKDSYRKADQDIVSASEKNWAAEAMSSLWENIRKKKQRMGKNYKPAKPGDKDRPTQEALKRAQGAPEVMQHYFKTKDEALKDAKKLGLKGFHSHETKDGKTLYMAGPSHEAFMKRHDEVMKEKQKKK